jgi:hypothetical protein
MIRAGDAFLLGYLPHLLRGHFEALELIEAALAGAAGELLARASAQRAALPRRGAELVSAVWTLEGVVGSGLGVEPPKPPYELGDVAPWSAALARAFVESNPEDELRTAHLLGELVGASEALVGLAVRAAQLGAADPTHAAVAARAAALRQALAAPLEAPASSDPTVAGELTALARERATAAADAGPPTAAHAAALAGTRGRIGYIARALESACRGTPRAAVAAWNQRHINGTELRRRLLEHRRWSVPCRMEEDGQPAPRVFAFDQRVLLAFSDTRALDQRPPFLVSDAPEDQLVVTVPGTALFSWVPDDHVDLLVLDATADPAAKSTINYPRDTHTGLRQAAADLALELALTDWSHLDLDVLRQAMHPILVDGNTVKNLLAPDGYGRPRVALFTSLDALELHVDRLENAALAGLQRLLVPGHTLFPELAKLDVAGVVYNPSGPFRSRSLNKRTIELLAAAGE